MTDQTTHQPLTDQQLDDIRARAQVATDGPWVLTDDLEGDGYPGHLWIVRTPASGPDEPDEHSAVVSIGDRALGEFIAHAPEDIAALLAEVRRLRTQLAAVHGLCDEQDQVARMLEFATPPWIHAVRAVVQSTDVNEMAASLRRDGFGPDQIATMLRPATDEEA
jgi:hypothetical protein